MIYLDHRLNLTMKEQIRALRKANLPTDPAMWTIAQTAKAELVLAQAQDEKITKLLEETP
jgi:hypothetical protein